MDAHVDAPFPADTTVIQPIDLDYLESLELQNTVIACLNSTPHHLYHISVSKSRRTTDQLQREIAGVLSFDKTPHGSLKCVPGVANADSYGVFPPVHMRHWTSSSSVEDLPPNVASVWYRSSRDGVAVIDLLVRALPLGQASFALIRSDGSLCSSRSSAGESALDPASWLQRLAGVDVDWTTALRPWSADTVTLAPFLLRAWRPVSQETDTREYKKKHGGHTAIQVEEGKEERMQKWLLDEVGLGPINAAWGSDKQTEIVFGVLDSDGDDTPRVIGFGFVYDNTSPYACTVSKTISNELAYLTASFQRFFSRRVFPPIAGEEVKSRLMRVDAGLASDDHVEAIPVPVANVESEIVRRQGHALVERCKGSCVRGAEDHTLVVPLPPHTLTGEPDTYPADRSWLGRGSVLAEKRSSECTSAGSSGGGIAAGSSDEGKSAADFLLEQRYVLEVCVAAGGGCYIVGDQQLRSFVLHNGEVKGFCAVSLWLRLREPSTNIHASLRDPATHVFCVPSLPSPTPPALRGIRFRDDSCAAPAGLEALFHTLVVVRVVDANPSCALGTVRDGIKCKLASMKKNDVCVSFVVAVPPHCSAAGLAVASHIAERGGVIAAVISTEYAPADCAAFAPDITLVQELAGGGRLIMPRTTGGRPCIARPSPLLTTVSNIPVSRRYDLLEHTDSSTAAVPALISKLAQSWHDGSASRSELDDNREVLFQYGFVGRRYQSSSLHSIVDAALKRPASCKPRRIVLHKPFRGSGATTLLWSLASDMAADRIPSITVHSPVASGYARLWAELLPSRASGRLVVLFDDDTHPDEVAAFCSTLTYNAHAVVVSVVTRDRKLPPGSRVLTVSPFVHCGGRASIEEIRALQYAMTLAYPESASALTTVANIALDAILKDEPPWADLHIFNFLLAACKQHCRGATDYANDAMEALGTKDEGVVLALAFLSVYAPDRRRVYQKLTRSLSSRGAHLLTVSSTANEVTIWHPWLARLALNSGGTDIVSRFQKALSGTKGILREEACEEEAHFAREILVNRPLNSSEDRHRHFSPFVTVLLELPGDGAAKVWRCAMAVDNKVFSVHAHILLSRVARYYKRHDEAVQHARTAVKETLILETLCLEPKNGALMRQCAHNLAVRIMHRGSYDGMTEVVTLLRFSMEGEGAHRRPPCVLAYFRRLLEVATGGAAPDLTEEDVMTAASEINLNRGDLDGGNNETINDSRSNSNTNSNSMGGGGSSTINNGNAIRPAAVDDNNVQNDDDDDWDDDDYDNDSDSDNDTVIPLPEWLPESANQVKLLKLWFA